MVVGESNATVAVESSFPTRDAPPPHPTNATNIARRIAVGVHREVIKFPDPASPRKKEDTGGLFRVTRIPTGDFRAWEGLPKGQQPAYRAHLGGVTATAPSIGILSHPHREHIEDASRFPSGKGSEPPRGPPVSTPPLRTSFGSITDPTV
jgi:hypothetical protein